MCALPASKCLQDWTEEFSKKWLHLLIHNIPVAVMEIKVFLLKTNQSDPSEDYPLVQQSGSAHTMTKSL